MTICKDNWKIVRPSLGKCVVNFYQYNEMKILELSVLCNRLNVAARQVEVGRPEPGSFRPTRTAIAKKTPRTNCGNSKPIRMEGNYMLKCSHWWQQLDFEKRKYAIKHIDIPSFHAFTIISYVTITDQSQNWGRESAPAVRRNRTTRGICAGTVPNGFTGNEDARPTIQAHRDISSSLKTRLREASLGRHGRQFKPIAIYLRH